MDMNVHKFLRMIPLTEEQKNRFLLCFLCLYFISHKNHKIRRLLRIASLPLALIADNISLTQTSRKAQTLQVAVALAVGGFAECLRSLTEYTKSTKWLHRLTRNLAAFAECSLFLIFDRRRFVPAPTRNLDRWQKYLR